MQRQEAARFVPVLENHTPHLLEEMKGIAEGAGVDLEDIVLLNARTELLSRGDAYRGGVSLRGHPECTSLAVLQGKHVALGQNWDWQPQMGENSLLLHITPTKGPAFTTFTEAGMVAKIGCNSSRLGVCLNYLHHRSELADLDAGVPVHVLLRLVLESSTLSDAQKKLQELPRSASANILIADGGSGSAVDLELTPGKSAAIGPTAGVVAHSNHFLDADLAQAGSYQYDSSSVARHRNAREAAQFRGPGSNPMARLRAALLDRTSPHPVSIDKPAFGGPVTVASVIMDLSAEKGPKLELCKGAPHANRWIAI